MASVYRLPVMGTSPLLGSLSSDALSCDSVSLGHLWGHICTLSRTVIEQLAIGLLLGPLADFMTSWRVLGACRGQGPPPTAQG